MSTSWSSRSSSPAMDVDSSPPSSPCTGPADSSPPSSPSLAPYVPPVCVDPYSGAYKQTRPPRLYEKKERVVAESSRAGAKRALETDGDTDVEDAPHQRARIESTPSLASVASVTSVNPHQLFDDAVTVAVDRAELKTVVHLAGKRLQAIPPFVEDLDKIVCLQGAGASVSALPPAWIEGARKRQLARAQTVPALGASPSALGRTSSGTLPPPIPPDQQEVQLYLATNEIASLPRELFTLRHLTVLSLYHNRISSVPPEIASLKNLRELNLSMNRLQYLPSEMLDMQLRVLNVSNNPWRAPSPPGAVPSTFPSLAEFCFRALVAPCRGGTMLEARYELPLGVHAPHIRDILAACVPRAIAKLSSAEARPAPSRAMHADEVTGVGCCPAPRHRDAWTEGGWRGGAPPLFAWHAEERFTSTREVANISLPEPATIRWRGCMPGCLDYLDPAPAGPAFASEDYEFSDDEDA